MNNFIGPEIEALVAELKATILHPRTLRILGKPKTARYYTNEVMTVHTTTGFYISPERMQRICDISDKAWVICIANVTVMHRFRRRGAFTHYLALVEELADQVGGRVRVELVGNKHLAAFLRRRGYVVEPNDYPELNPPTFWQPLKVADHA